MCTSCPSTASRCPPSSGGYWIVVCAPLTPPLDIPLPPILLLHRRESSIHQYSVVLRRPRRPITVAAGARAMPPPSPRHHWHLGSMCACYLQPVPPLVVGSSSLPCPPRFFCLHPCPRRVHSFFRPLFVCPVGSFLINDDNCSTSSPTASRSSLYFIYAPILLSLRPEHSIFTGCALSSAVHKSHSILSSAPARVA